MLTIQEVIECTTWKTCTKCGEEKKTVMFSRMRGAFRPDCKSCNSKDYHRRKQSRPIVTEVQKSLIQRLYSWIVK